MHNVSNRPKKSRLFNREASCYELGRACVNPSFEKIINDKLARATLCVVTQTVFGTRRTASSDRQPLFASLRFQFPAGRSARFPQEFWTARLLSLATLRGFPRLQTIDARSGPLCCPPAA